MALLQALALLALGGTAPGSPVLYSIDEVWARHHQLDGQVIQVEGVVLKCYQLGCSLRESALPKAKALGLGGGEKFDQEIQPLLGRRLVIEGRFDATCLHIMADPPKSRDQIVVCTDRATMLHDPKIIRAR